MHWHVLDRKVNLDGQPAELKDLAQAKSNRNRPDIFRRRGPVRQDVARVPETPALAEKDRRDRLKIHLVGVGPTMLAADGPPLLGEYADKEFLGEVAYHHARTELPLALAGEM